MSYIGNRIDYSDVKQRVFSNLEKHAPVITPEERDRLARLGVQKPKKLQCPHCLFDSDRPRDMNTHLLCHTRNKEFKCDLCNFSSDKPSIVTRHMNKNHHPEDIPIKDEPVKVY